MAELHICEMAWRIGDLTGVAEMLAWVRDAGFDGVGFHAAAPAPGACGGVDPAATDAAARARLRRELRDFAVREVHASSAFTLRDNTLDAHTEELLKTLDFACDIGATVVTVHAALPAVEAGRGPADWERAMERLNARAAEHDVRVGVENLLLWRSSAQDTFAWLTGLGLSHVGITLDVGHMFLDGGTPVRPFGTIGEVVRRLGRKLVHLHVHDFDGTRDHIAPGTGNIDWDDLVRALTETGFSGGLCLELNPGLVSPDATRRCLAWLRERIAMVQAGEKGERESGKAAERDEA